MVPVGAVEHTLGSTRIAPLRREWVSTVGAVKSMADNTLVPSVPAPSHCISMFYGYEVNNPAGNGEIPVGYIMFPSTSFAQTPLSSTTQPHRPVATGCHNQSRRKRVRT